MQNNGVQIKKGFAELHRINEEETQWEHAKPQSKQLLNTCRGVKRALILLYPPL